MHALVYEHIFTVGASVSFGHSSYKLAHYSKKIFAVLLMMYQGNAIVCAIKNGNEHLPGMN
jgi:hypothetical protein